ncbi:MAG: hypothetical protein V4584_07870 [Verrucomicrobiota bacterium]
MRFSCLCTLALIPGLLLAAEPKNETARQVRFLAVGELPPFRQEIRDNVRYELEPPAGSIPPREVVLGFGAGQPEAAPLRLGQMTEALKAPVGAGPLLLSRRGDAKDSEPWLRLNRPESGNLLVLLWRDARAGTWEKVRSLVLSDEEPAGSVRFVNCSPAPVGILLGPEKLILEAGKAFKRPVTTGVDQIFEVHLTDTTGSLKRLHSGVIVQNPGERSLIIVYRADGSGARRPLKVIVQREAVPAVPEKK